MPSGSGDRNFLFAGAMDLGPVVSQAELFLSVLGIIHTAVIEGVLFFFFFFPKTQICDYSTYI